MNPIQKTLDIQLFKHAVDYELIDTVETSDFKRHLIHYSGSEGDDIKAFLFVPNGREIKGGLLVHHQHNGERNWGKSEVAGIVGDRYQHFCPSLAKMGFVSLAPDSICFEDRRTNKQGVEPDSNPENDWIQHYNQMCYRLLRGTHLMKKVIEDSSIAISLLSQQEGVNEASIGMLGHSYGGNTVIFHTALDDRIKFCLLERGSLQL